MIGRIQKTFNQFHHRKADRNRTYRHGEILNLEAMIIRTIQDYVKQVHNREPHSEKGIDITTLCEYHKMEKALIGGSKPDYHTCQYSGCNRAIKSVKQFYSYEEGYVYMCAPHRAINEGKTGYTFKKGRRS